MIIKIIIALFLFFVGLCYGYIRHDNINVKLSNFIFKIFQRKINKMTKDNLDELDKIFNSNDFE